MLNESNSVIKLGNTVVNPYDYPNSIGRDPSYDLFIERRDPYIPMDRKRPAPSPMSPATNPATFSPVQKVQAPTMTKVIVMDFVSL